MSQAAWPFAGLGLTVELYEPHPGQWPMHQSTARFRVGTCGRRFGKTWMAVNELAHFALTHPKTRTAWVAPSYKQALVAFRLFVEHYYQAMRTHPARGQMQLEWRSGAMTDFRTAENYDAIRGEGYHFLVGDEFSLWTREAWEAAVRPTLSDTMGKALLVGTPKGRNLFWELWMRGQDRQAWPDYESWQFPTAANPWIPEGEIDEARMSLPGDVFRQEYEAAFLEDGGAVFRGISHCWDGELEEPVYGGVYVIGWDPAKRFDASVAIVIDVRRQQVVAWERMLGQEYTLQVARVAAMARRYNSALILMDSTGVGDPVQEQVVRTGLPVEGYQFTATSKQQLIEHLVVQIEQRAVRWPASLAVLNRELEAYSCEVGRAGAVRYGAPEGQHDDAVTALALAAWAARIGMGAVSGTKQAARPPIRVPRGAMP